MGCQYYCNYVVKQCLTYHTIGLIANQRGILDMHEILVTKFAFLPASHPGRQYHLEYFDFLLSSPTSDARFQVWLWYYR